MLAQDYTKLLFAAEVRKLAVEMWTTERNNARNSSMRVTPEEIDAWDKAHPFGDYLNMALAQILKVAVLIDDTERELT